jgi:integrase/recombinase XerD
MIEDMNARKLGEGTQRGHIQACKRFAAFLKRSPDTAPADDVRRFQLDLSESGTSICNRNRIMTGVKFLLRVTLRRHDLAAEVYHIKEPLNLPLTLSPEEARQLLASAGSLRLRVMLALAYGCGLRAGEVARLRAGDAGSGQGIIRVVQSKGRKDRHVMLPAEVLELLRQWWKERPTRADAGVPPLERLVCDYNPPPLAYPRVGCGRRRLAIPAPGASRPFWGGATGMQIGCATSCATMRLRGWLTMTRFW